MRIKLNVKVEFFGQDVLRASDEALAPLLMQCGFLVERASKASMKRGGRTLLKRKRKGQRGKVRRRGLPSTPPNPPHAQTGNLKASITTALTARHTALVGPTRQAWYGKVHEKGGIHGGRNYPRRAFMLPALRSSISKFPGLIRRQTRLAQTPAGRRLNARRRPRR